MVSCAHSSLHVSALDTDPYTAQRANELWIQTAAVDVTAFVMGKLRLLDAVIRRILPVRLDAPDADAPAHITQTLCPHRPKYYIGPSEAYLCCVLPPLGSFPAETRLQIRGPQYNILGPRLY